MKRFFAVTILFTLLTGLLPGCKTDDVSRCKRAYKKMQGWNSCHFTVSHKYDDKELLQKEIWLCAEEYLLLSVNTEETKWYLRTENGYWHAWGYDYNAWQTEKIDNASSPSDFWKYWDWEKFETGKVTVSAENGETVVSSFIDLGDSNCTTGRQTETWHFYLENGVITKITSSMTTYNGSQIDPENIHSVSEDVYTFYGYNEPYIKERIQTEESKATE